MLSLEVAKERLLASVSLLTAERALLLDAVGLFAAESLTSRVDLPGFDNSAMDGYAVRSEDLKEASSRTVTLRQAGKIAAGESFSPKISAGECLRVFTGSALPEGADAVVMQEDVIVKADGVRFAEPVKPLENVRLRGEDIRVGAGVVQESEQITSTRAALLAATGHRELLVRRAPSIALLSTGSELVEPGEALAPGKIYESNRTLLAGVLRDINCAPKILPLVPDDLKSTRAALEAAFATATFVITTGGVSVGEFDFVKEAFHQLGGEIDFWKIAIRPGKPFVFGTLDAKMLFGLPGNPISAFVTFLLLVRPALLKAMGARHVDLPCLHGELTERILNRSDRRHFVRARWKLGRVHMAGRQSSHMIGSLGDANCLIEVPPEAELKAGSIVASHLWQLPNE